MNLSEVVGQSAVTTRLKNYVKERSMPHLLFAGPAGIGKTTSALALAREMFGDLWRHNLHELNASDERECLLQSLVETIRGEASKSLFFRQFTEGSDLLFRFLVKANFRGDSLFVGCSHVKQSTKQVSQIISEIRPVSGFESLKGKLRIVAHRHFSHYEIAKGVRTIFFSQAKGVDRLTRTF